MRGSAPARTALPAVARPGAPAAAPRPGPAGKAEAASPAVTAAGVAATEPAAARWWAAPAARSAGAAPDPTPVAAAAPVAVAAPRGGSARRAAAAASAAVAAGASRAAAPADSAAAAGGRGAPAALERPASAAARAQESPARGGGGAGLGGAVFNMQGTLTVRNSTLSNNTAQGGGVERVARPRQGLRRRGLQPERRLHRSRVDPRGQHGGSQHRQRGGQRGLQPGLRRAPAARTAQTTLRNTILGQGTGDDTLVSNRSAFITPSPNLGTATAAVGDRNLVRSSSVLDGGTITGTALTGDPLLGPLGNNGGPTRPWRRLRTAPRSTQAPPSGSPGTSAAWPAPPTSSTCPTRPTARTSARSSARPPHGRRPAAGWQRHPPPHLRVEHPDQPQAGYAPDPRARAGARPNRQRQHLHREGPPPGSDDAPAARAPGSGDEVREAALVADLHAQGRDAPDRAPAAAALPAAPVGYQGQAVTADCRPGPGPGRQEAHRAKAASGRGSGARGAARSWRKLLHRARGGAECAPAASRS